METNLKLTGKMKLNAENLVSPRYAKKAFSDKIGVTLESNKTFDYVDFSHASQATPIKEPNQMLSNCRTSLWRRCYWANAMDTITKITVFRVGAGVKATLGLDCLVTKAEYTASGNVFYDQAKHLTVKFGAPMPFTTLEGYKFILKPTPTGTVDAIAFTALPNINVPIYKDGFILDDNSWQKLKEVIINLLVPV